jgi:CRISPR/Cas system-associated exonuclease Cas4 (RecB family)
MSDERLGLPSASGIERIALCPSSWGLSQQVTDEPEDSEDAASGRRSHRFLAGDRMLDLTESELATAWDCEALRDLLIDRSVEAIEVKERRMYYIDPATGMAVFSGAPDLVRISTGNALIVDYKTGRNEVTLAPGNLQLRAYAVLVRNLWREVKTARVAIVQPLVRPQVSVCDYTEQDLNHAEQEILAILAARRPNEYVVDHDRQCKYCPAKTICPAVGAVASRMGDSLGETQLAVQRHGTVALNAMPPESLGYIAELVATYEPLLKAEIRKRIERGEPVPGWALKPGAETRKITDPASVWERCAKVGFVVRDFLPAVTVKLGELRKRVAAVTGTKGKCLDAQMDGILDGCVEVSVGEKRLVRE